MAEFTADSSPKAAPGEPSAELRPAGPDDVDRGLLEVLDQVSAAGTAGLARERAAEIIAGMQARQVEQLWVAVREGRVVGTATLVVEQKLIHGGSRAGRIEDVVVDSRSRRQGIGRELIERLSALAAELGCYKVVLGCDPATVGFYEKCGFRRHDVGMRRDSVSGGAGSRARRE